MLKYNYTALKSHLSSIQAIKHIDWFLDQYAQVGEDHIHTTPEVLIEFAPINWTTLPSGVQRGVLTFITHTVSDSAYGDERDMTDTLYINHLDIDQKIFQKLMNKRFMFSDVPGNEALAGTDNDYVLMESIVRIESIPHTALSNLVSTLQTFQCTIYDYSAVPSMQEVLATLQCNISLTSTIE